MAGKEVDRIGLPLNQIFVRTAGSFLVALTLNAGRTQSTHSQEPTPIGPIPIEQQSAEILGLIKRLEEKWDIKIGYQRVVGIPVEHIIQDDHARLEMLDHHLSLLPERLIKSREGGGLMITIMPYLQRTRCECWPIYQVLEDRVYLHAQEHYTPENEVRSFQYLVQELANRIMPITVKIDPDDPRVRSYFSPWFGEIEQILGSDFSSVRKDVFAKILTERPNIRLELSQRRAMEMTDGEFFLLEFLQAIGMLRADQEQNPYFDYPIELFGDLAANYVLGKEHFFDMYGRIFNRIVVEGLYEFVKDNIFEGDEYNMLVIPYPQDDPLVLIVRTPQGSAASRSSAIGAIAGYGNKNR